MKGVKVTIKLTKDGAVPYLSNPGNYVGQVNGTTCKLYDDGKFGTLYPISDEGHILDFLNHDDGNSYYLVRYIDVQGVEMIFPIHEDNIKIGESNPIKDIINENEDLTDIIDKFFPDENRT